MKTTFAALIVLALLASSSQASVIVPLDGFESHTLVTDLGAWTPNAIANTGLYIHQTQLQPSDNTTHNFASAGGTHAASLGKAGGTMTSGTLDLSGGGASETLTIALDFQWHNGTSTRRAYIDFSNDGGSTWYLIAGMQIGSAGAASNDTSYSGTVTITEGTTSVVRTDKVGLPTKYSGAVLYNGSAFTNNSLVRIWNSASAGADARLFIDDLEVTSSVPEPAIPEPATLALFGLGGLMMIRRRRSA